MCTVESRDTMGVIPFFFNPALPCMVLALNILTPGWHICAPSNVSSSNTLQRQQIHELKALVHPSWITPAAMLPSQIVFAGWGFLSKKKSLLFQSALLEVSHLPRAPFPECLFCPTTSLPTPLCSEFQFFSIFWEGIIVLTGLWSAV